MVKEKELANFCGYFTPSERSNTKKSSKKLLSREEAEKKWSEMFKKK
ncbi:hypothetical protein ACFL7D_01350 [candidate division KSB1 bacterium]